MRCRTRRKNRPLIRLRLQMRMIVMGVAVGMRVRMGMRVGKSLRQAGCRFFRPRGRMRRLRLCRGLLRSHGDTK